jgi:hypothetical protein
MLLAGLLLRNATPSLVAGLPPAWSATFRALALGTIFLRSGLELDLQVRADPPCMSVVTRGSVTRGSVRRRWRVVQPPSLLCF